MQWARLRTQLQREFDQLGVRVAWIDANCAFKPAAQIDILSGPFLGGEDPLFGTRFTGVLLDFFDTAALRGLAPDPSAALSIVYGCGAALAGWGGVLAYVDVPKNEIQFRARAGAALPLGAAQAPDPKTAYKRGYFVDWPALNAHKATLLPALDWIIDEQRPDDITFMRGVDLRSAMTAMARSGFRPRPWFEPGPWGGQWLKQHVPQLPQDAPNYAWSFEAIVPENGLMLRSAGLLLEFAFDWLMIHNARAVLGDAWPVFGREFPIRFDYLDTMGGGNLSLQCHPRPDYIRAHFGERFTQDETYYIVDCAPGAHVYLGFRPNVNREIFHAALNDSARQGMALDVARFVHSEAAHRHDLFLIPSGTIHCAGADTMVLEISATPYIFTFKMYDWLRAGLDGAPRPLNIARAMANLVFQRGGECVKTELISRPAVLSQGPGWRVVHLPTHAEHFYDVERVEFSDAFDGNTGNQCHVLNLVAGESVLIESGGVRQSINAAETFIVPAAAGRYRLINQGGTPAWVIRAFVKPEFCRAQEAAPWI